MRHTHLTLLLQNLIDNAIKYRADQSPVVRIAAEPDGTMWRIRIRDNGIGIPKPYSSTIFGVFRRLHSTERYAGTGIGLAICQKIVLRYGGRIWVESEGEGYGSTFCFTLPGEASVSTTA